MRTALRRGQLCVVLFWLVGCACFCTAAVPIASAQFQAWVMAKLPDTPEGMAIDSQGNLYTTLFHTGEIIRLKNDGGYDHVVWVSSKEESGKGNLIGLDFDKTDNIYVAYKAHSKYDATDLVNPFHPSCRDATVTRSGVYKGQNRRARQKMAGRPKICLTR